MAHKLPLNDIRFLTEFHAYCLTRGDEAYSYYNARNCACGQFLKSREPAFFCTGGPWWYDNKNEAHDLPEGLAAATAQLPFTFSALATRLEALLADAPAVVLPA
jgi:hypothetical protein